MESKARHALQCALTYRECTIQSKPLRNEYETPAALLDDMMHVLMHEAHHDMSESIAAPQNPYMHPIDMHTSEPGIVTGTRATEVVRHVLPMPAVQYQRRVPPRAVRAAVSEPIAYDAAMETAQKEYKKSIANNVKCARRDVAKDAATERKIAKRAELKEARALETPEERAARLAEAREKRAANKRKKEMEKDGAAKDSDQAAAAEEPVQDMAEEPVANAAEEPVEDVAEDNAKKDDESNPLNQDAFVVGEADRFPARLRVNRSKAKFYNTPIPHDRHLSALQASWPAPALENALLGAQPNPNVRVVQGPPGTGKTQYLVDSLAEFEQRVLVCACTNVAVANLYSRIVASGTAAALVMAPSRVPPGTPITSQDPGARVVCATISSRSGPLLDGHAFDVVLVDEAAQCMEAMVWGVIRPEVQTLVLVGDTRQLPALVSRDGQASRYDRSLMERLVEGGYPTLDLCAQRRMHPEIVSYPNRAFYDGALHTVYPERGQLPVPPYRVVNCEGECKTLGDSRLNDVEAAAVVKIASEIGTHYSDTVILAPYQAQCRLLASLNSGYDVHTVDSFQGREADAVIMSATCDHEPGFMSEARRLVVALTRARHCMRIVGNTTRWIGPLRDIYVDASNRNLVD